MMNEKPWWTDPKFYHHDRLDGELVASHARHMAIEEAMEVVANEQKSEHDRYYNAERTSMLKHDSEAALEIRIERDAVLSTYAYILEALKNMKT